MPPSRARARSPEQTAGGWVNPCRFEVGNRHNLAAISLTPLFSDAQIAAYRSLATARFQIRSSGQGNSTSPFSCRTISTRTGLTFLRLADAQTRHQKRERAAVNRSSHPRRSKCHQRQCASNRAECPQAQTGIMACCRVAASRMHVGTISPSVDQRISQDHSSRIGPLGLSRFGAV